MPYVEDAGDRFHYLDEGAGETVVFVHGSVGGLGQWKGLAGALADRYRIIRLDLPGMGGSERWPLSRPWSMDDDERAIEAVLARIDGPFHLVAHSAGARFSFRSLLRHRDRVRSVTWFEPALFNLLHAFGDEAFDEPAQMAEAYRSAIDAGRHDDAMAGFVDKWAKAEGMWAGMPASVKEQMWPGAWRLYHEWPTVWIHDPDIESFKAIEMPLLLVKGTDTIRSMDRICEILRREMPAIGYAEIVGAGHMLPFTHWRQTLPLVEAQLQGR